MSVNLHMGSDRQVNLHQDSELIRRTIKLKQENRIKHRGKGFQKNNMGVICWRGVCGGGS